MHERRSTVRAPVSLIIRYGPSTSSVIGAGRLVDLSDQGARLLVRDRLAVGLPLAVQLARPGERAPLVASGLVRWVAARTHRWAGRIPCGVEWLPMEDTMRHRMRDLVRAASQGAGTRSTSQAALWRRMAGSALLGMALAGCLWAAELLRERRALEEAVAHRNAVIQHLEGQKTQLGLELLRAHQALAQTQADVAGLDASSRHVQEEMRRLSEEVRGIQAGYADAQTAHGELLEQVRVLDRAASSARVFPELERAIQEAIASRRR